MYFVATVSRLNDLPKLKVGNYKAYLCTDNKVELGYRYGGKVYRQTKQRQRLATIVFIATGGYVRFVAGV